MDRKIKSVWRGKYKNLKEWYAKAKVKDACPWEEDDEKKERLLYDPEFFTFDKFQLEIDPDETLEMVELYDTARQHQEIVKCCYSFPYFCQKYVKILHPMAGLIPFIIYGYQAKVIKDYNEYRFNIISKFRQGGLTTVTLLWGLWRCLFKTDQQVMLLSKTDREATDIGMIVDRAVENLPGWLRPAKDGKWNDHLKTFPKTGGALKFYSPEAARGKSVTFLIIDEAAFIPDMETHWKAMWPVLSTGGSCTLVSTVNGLGNWYEETYTGAKEKRNKFHIIDLDYWEHPDYSEKYNPGWVEDQKAQLGEKGFLQEVMRSFLGTGDTYFPAHIIGELDKETRDNYPRRKLFSRWANKARRSEDNEAKQRKVLTRKLDDKGNEVPPSPTEDDESPSVAYERGAMWVWKEPVDSHEYMIGVDCAEGMGESGDNSCFQVVDTATLEQVAEFYSNSIQPHYFSQVLNEIGIYYNNALIVVEDMAPGGAVLSNLQHELFYENLFYDEKGSKSGRPGIKVGRANRPLLLEALQHRLINGTIRINSHRLLREMMTFEFNAQTRRAEAQKGKHDDAIMALCMALYVRDGLMRDIPMGAEVPTEITATFKTEIYEEIKLEIQKGVPRNFIEEPADWLAPDKKDIMPGVVFNYQRRYDRLLKEFGW